MVFNFTSIAQYFRILVHKSQGRKENFDILKFECCTSLRKFLDRCNVALLPIIVVKKCAMSGLFHHYFELSCLILNGLSLQPHGLLLLFVRYFVSHE